MKPTKEQLADPKWWDAYTNNAKYCYRDRMNNSIAFKLTECLDGSYELLAKRPQPEWRPEVGVDCIQKMGGGDRKVSITYVGDGVGCYYDYKNEMEYTFSMRDSVFVPIKTQREELIEIIEANLEANVGLGDIAGVILAKYDLTEKGGER
jgi:hypothetical protein